MRTAVAFSALLFAAGCAATPIIGESDKVTETESTAPIATEVEIVREAASKTDIAIVNVEDEKLSVLLDEAYEAGVARSPLSQTYLGRRTNYDKWDDVSDAARVAAFEERQSFLQRMREEIDKEALSEDAQLSYRLFEYINEREARGFQYRKNGFVFDQMYGQQSSIPAFLINQHRVKTASDANAYISRLEGVKGYMGQHLANARERALMGVRPPRFVYDYVIADAKNVLNGAPFSDGADSPLFADFKSKVQALNISPDEKLDLITRAHNALMASVKPAYQEVTAWLEADREKASDDDGVWRLSDGADYYAYRLFSMTTTDMTADEIHQLGLAEVARIHAEMKAIKDSVGYTEDLNAFFDHLRTSPEFYYENSDEGRAAYLKDATAMIDDMREKLPTVFNTFPKADLVVKRVEPFREKSAGKAFYQRPAIDGSRPGTYYANLYNMADMPIYQMEALAFHEAIPGHHMQLAIAQELENVPQFRKFSRFTAYTEGWGLYSEYLPKEMGFYEDPYSDFGRLAMELWRAARLVVDTGLHEKKWTRQEAIDYLMENTPNPEGDCKKAIDRYIVMPGQATAYKIGMIKILELREAAKAQMGDAFDLGDFHDVVLSSGPVPLSILEERVNAWVKSSQSN